MREGRLNRKALLAAAVALVVLVAGGTVWYFSARNARNAVRADDVDRLRRILDVRPALSAKPEAASHRVRVGISYDPATSKTEWGEWLPFGNKASAHWTLSRDDVVRVWTEPAREGCALRYSWTRGAAEHSGKRYPFAASQIKGPFALVMRQSETTPDGQGTLWCQITRADDRESPSSSVVRATRQ
jgi:hypothetical protein